VHQIITTEQRRTNELRKGREKLHQQLGEIKESREEKERKK